MHKFMKMAGCNTEEEFYQKYPSEKAFFAAYPHMKGNQTMKNGGAASGHSGSYWNGDSWVSNAGDSGTYANGVYYANGGPTFPIGGSAPIFGRGGVASFNISNNEYPSPFAMAPGSGMGSGYLQDLPTHMGFGGITPGAEIVDPFAMYPGSGSGGGMLQDLPTEMKRGGKHKKHGKHHDKKLTPQQMQMMMQAMAMAQQPQGMPMSPQGGGQPMMSPEEQQMMAMQQQGGGQPMPGMMKSGGIHIAPSKRGTFTAAATKHGKSVQGFASQVLANKENYSPAMVKKANFARNASKWQHEYGGMYEDGGSTMPDNPGFRALPSAVQQKIMSNMQTGGMVTDDRMVYGPGGQYMQDGGMINPYHPMAKFMRGGYYQTGGDYMSELDYRTRQKSPIDSMKSLFVNMRDYKLYSTPDEALAKRSGYPYEKVGNEFHVEVPKSQEQIKNFGKPKYETLPGLPKTGNMKIEQFQNGGDASTPIGKYVPGLGYWNGSTFQPTNPNSFAASNMGEAEEYPSEMPTVPPPMPPVQDPNRAANTGVVQQTPDPAETATWRQGMTDQQAQQALENRPTTTDYAEQFEPKPSGWDKARNWGNAILGTGMTALGVAGALNERTQARKLRNKQFNDRSTANMYAAMNQPGGKGDYTQQGVFRPDSMTPTAAGKFYPGMAKMGGVMNNYTYAHGGYHVGQEVELSDAEIANLKRMGYKFDII